MVFEKVVKILADYKDLDAAKVTRESSLAELGFDSLDVVELVMQFEDEFGVSIEMNESLKTVGALSDFIESELAKK